MNLYELSAYLLPAVMLIFVTFGSLSPYLMNKRRRKKKQADDSIADEKKVREVSYELVTSIPSSDNGKGIDYGRILGTLRILEQERESELRA